MVNEPVSTYVVTATFAAANLQVSIYPNPASSTLTIDLQNGLLNELRATLFNALGRPVTAPAALHPSVPVELDLAQLAAGIYFLRIEGEGTSSTQKIMVTH